MKPIVLILISFICIINFVFSSAGFASTSVFSLNFYPEDLIFEKVKGYDKVRIVGGRFSAEPGSPLLPVKYIQIAIPTELEVERIEVISSAHQELPGTYKIYPAQPFYPLSSLSPKEQKIEFIDPDPLLYGLSSEYPGNLAQVTNNGFLGGQHIAGVALYPLQYIPSEGKLILYTRIEFELIFKFSSHSPVNANRRSEKGVKFYSHLAKSLVINPEEVNLEIRGFLTPEEEVDYLIITHDFFVSTFQELADWKILKGISTEIRDIFWVLSNYSGYDDPEKIRNCIRDFYSNHGTKWVLLGGDTQIVPYREAWYIPCDFYYSDLDSNWDANENHIYGEYEDSLDLYPDVFVGRAPCSNIAQAQTFVNKCLTYEIDPPTDYQERILYAAEVLWPGTDAAELKDYIDSSFVPDYFETTKLYETSGTLNRSTFGDGLNQGQNIINHSGHGDFFKLSIGEETWYGSDMDSLINAPGYSLLYTFGCYTAAIDEDCIAEHFINNPNGGGFAYCGNTRAGWGVIGAPLEGPGPEMDIEFFRVLFDSSYCQLGKTLGISKIPFIPISQEENEDGSFYRYTIFCLLLLGDPTLDLWTDIPAELSISHASSILIGADHFQVNVVQDSALVCCVKEGQIMGTAYSSGGSATVYFDSPLIFLGTMQVTVTKHNFLPYQDTILIKPPEGPYVVYHSHQIDDSQGNNNGVVNPGEIISMSLTVENIGSENAYNVSATLSEEDDFITLVDSVKDFGNIDPGMTAQSLGPYVFQVSSLCPDSHLVTFALEASDGVATWPSIFFEIVTEPDFITTVIPDTAVVNLGDSISIKLIFTSVGGFDSEVNLSHSELPSGVNGFLNPDQLVPTDSSIFRIYTAPEAPPGIHPVTITADGGGITHDIEAVLGILPPPYSGPLWHVSISGHDSISNGSAQHPFRTIQKGINSASDGDTVLVGKGRYVENIDFLGKSILVASHYIFEQEESTIESTIIDGNHQGSVVTFESDEDSNSVIRGFTLTGGYATYGGGIYSYSSSPTIADNFLINNACDFIDDGAAIYCDNRANLRIYRNLIANNDVSAGIYIYLDCDVLLISNTVCNNTGGGVIIREGSDVYLKNNIFSNNFFYGINIGQGCWWDVAYNNVFGSEENYYGDLEDQTGINGNISVDPLFVDSAAGDYHLSPESPCIDAGDLTDPVPQGGGLRIDMGALEYQQGFNRGDANRDGAVTLLDVVYLIYYLFKEGPAPDPLKVGDVNRDDSINVTDVVYLINYLLKEGPSPY
jgi:hypothetical protein